MAKQRVTDWPTYLLKGVPEHERGLLTQSAGIANKSVSDVVRSILCAHYRMECPRESLYYDERRDTGSTTLLLRLQPKLDAALQRESARTGHSRRRIILETITSHYKKGEPS